MSKQNRYIVVTAYSLAELQGRVENQVELGYEPLGGLTVEIIPKIAEYSQPYTLYHQALLHPMSLAYEIETIAGYSRTPTPKEQA